MKEPEIKEATRADIPAIIAIIGQTWGPTYQAILSQEQRQFMLAEVYNPAALEKQLADGQRFLLLESAGQPAGFAAYSPVGPDTCKLNKLYVDPAYQGKSYGRLLLEKVEQDVRKNGGLNLVLNVNRFNKAVAFYQHLGYTLLREEDVPIGQYWMNDYLMHKTL